MIFITRKEANKAIRVRIGNVPIAAIIAILKKAPTTKITKPNLALSGPNTTIKVFLPVALSP